MLGIRTRRTLPPGYRRGRVAGVRPVVCGPGPAQPPRRELGSTYDRHQGRRTFLGAREEGRRRALPDRRQQPRVPGVLRTARVDRDPYPLVGDGVRIMTTSRGITDTRVYDREGVVDRYGIPPDLIPDFIGLKGDTSDNIPGVPGIGDKTAAELLQRFGSLEQVLDQIADISGAKRQQNLIQHADDARVSKVLATIKRDIPIELDISHFATQEPDRSRLREVFRQFELREPLRRLEEALGSADAAAPAPAAGKALHARVQEAGLEGVRAL